MLWLFSWSLSVETVTEAPYSLYPGFVAQLAPQVFYVGIYGSFGPFSHGSQAGFQQLEPTEDLGLHFRKVGKNIPFCRCKGYGFAV